MFLSVKLILVWRVEKLPATTSRLEDPLFHLWQMVSTLATAAVLS